MTKSAFIVIDIQNDYFPTGTMTLYQPELAANQAKRALAHARKQKIPVIIVQHLALNLDATFFRPNTPGAALYSGFEPQDGEQILIKHYANAFRETNLAQRLGQLEADSLVVCGMMTHMCIDSTVRAAADRGYAVTLLGDAVATRDLTYNQHTVEASAVQTAVLAALHGTFAQVVPTETWIANSRIV